MCTCYNGDLCILSTRLYVWKSENIEVVYLPIGDPAADAIAQHPDGSFQSNISASYSSLWYLLQKDVRIRLIEDLPQRPSYFLTNRT